PRHLAGSRLHLRRPPGVGLTTLNERPESAKEHAMFTSRRILILLVGTLALAGAAVAGGGEPPELATSNLNTSAGKLTALKAGVTYQASAFPIALRVTPTDGTWAGTQWKTSSHGQPAFGWTAF